MSSGLLRGARWLGDLSRVALIGAATGALLAGLVAAAGYRSVSDTLVLAAASAAVVGVLLGLVSLLTETDDEPGSISLSSPSPTPSTFESDRP